eukprot:281357-Prymnesium_polylepis.1
MPTEPHRLVAIMFFATTVLPRHRRTQLWPRSPQIRRSLHTSHSLTVPSRVGRCAVAVQQPT